MHNLPLTPELEDAANRAFTGVRDLSYWVDKTLSKKMMGQK